MRRNSSGPGGDDPPSGVTLDLQLPLGDVDLFRHGAAEPILDFLAHHPDLAVSTRHLADLVGYSEKATRTAVDTLDRTTLIETRREGNRRLVSVARGSLTRPEDPFDRIVQPAFRLPVRLAVHELERVLDGILAVVLFGSVARGEANPQSDVDLWVLVEDDREQQLHEANRVSKRLSGIQIPPKIALQRQRGGGLDSVDIDDYLTRIEAVSEAAEATAGWSHGPAPAYEILVETPGSTLRQEDRIADELFVEGIVLEDSETFRRIRREVLRG